MISERAIGMTYCVLPHDHGNSKRIERLALQLDRAGDFSAAAEVFRVLNDSSRLRIFWLLCHCEECVLNISAITQMSSPAVSHHLRILKDAGLVVSSRSGKEVCYRASDNAQSRLLHSMIERVMEISCPKEREDEVSEEVIGGFSAEQVMRVQHMHDRLRKHPELRPTIDELAKDCLMNPTTLKALFKAVYGESIAAHMKEHRMEKAAELLRSGEMSVSDIAEAVGYNSTSRFSGAFKKRYNMLPSEYRKDNGVM